MASDSSLTLQTPAPWPSSGGLYAGAPWTQHFGARRTARPRGAQFGPISGGCVDGSEEDVGSQVGCCVRVVDASRHEPLHVLDMFSVEHLEGVRVRADDADTLDVVHTRSLPKDGSALHTYAMALRIGRFVRPSQQNTPQRRRMPNNYKTSSPARPLGPRPRAAPLREPSTAT